MTITFSISFRRMALAFVAAATVTAAQSQEQSLSSSSEVLTLFQGLIQRYIRENVDKLTEIDAAYSEALRGLSTENSERLNAFLDQQRADIRAVRELGLDVAERDRRMREIQDGLAAAQREQFDYYVAERNRLGELHTLRRDAQRSLHAELIQRLQAEQRSVLANLSNGPVNTEAVLAAVENHRSSLIVQQASTGDLVPPVDTGAGAGSQAALPAAGVTLPAAANIQDCDLAAPLNSQRTTVLPNNRLLEIDVAGDPLRLLFHWDGLPGTDMAPRDGVPDIVQAMVDQIDTTLEAFAASGFRNIPGLRRCERDNVFEILVYPVVGQNTPGGDATAEAFDFRFAPGAGPMQILDSARNTIIHELFHSIQLNYTLNGVQQWLLEGSAVLAPDLFDAELDASRFDLPSGGTDTARSCEEQLLDDPQKNIMRRDSRFEDGTNACQSKLFWRYFAEQIGDSANEPARGADALAGLFAQMNDSPAGWRIQNSDKIIGAGDFDGDGRDEILLQSATHIGLISGTYGENRVVNVTRAGQRLGAGGWTLDRGDELLAVANFNGDGQADVLVMSQTHIGFLGLDENNAFRTLGSVAFDSGRFGNGWRPFSTDEFLGVADLNGDGRDEVILRSNGYLGAVGLSRTNAPESVAVTQRSALFGGARALRDAAEIAGATDMNGDGREELIAKDRQGVFVFGLDSAGRFALIDAVDNDEPYGGEWVAAASDRILGLGNLDDDVDGRNEFVVQNGGAYGFIGLDGADRLANRGTVLLIDRRPGELEVAIGNVDDEPDAEMIVKSADELRIIKVSDSFSIDQIAVLRAENMAQGEVAVLAAMNEPGVKNILVRSPSDWRVYGYHDAAGLVYESTISVNGYFDDLLAHLDRLIRARTSDARDLASFWRDFSIALYIKNLDPATLAPEHFFIDERNDGFQYTATGGAVSHAADTRWGILAYTDSRDIPIHSERWSANYFRVTARPAESQRVTVNLRPNGGEGPVSANVVIIENDQLVALYEDANPRGGVMLRSFLLAPGQELGLIVSSAYNATDYDLRLVSTPP